MSDEQRERLIGEVIAALRADGSARDAFDQAAADRMAINLTDHRCLDVLDQRGTSTAGEIAAALGLTTGSVTALLDRLERVGYVRRLRDPDDRRRVLVEITPQAQRLGHDIYGPMGADGHALLARCTLRDLTFLREFMRRSREIQMRHEARIRALPPVRPQQGGDR